MNCPHCDYTHTKEKPGVSGNFYYQPAAMRLMGHDPWSPVTKERGLFGCPSCMKTFISSVIPMMGM